MRSGTHLESPEPFWGFLNHSNQPIAGWSVLNRCTVIQSPHLSHSVAKPRTQGKSYSLLWTNGRHLWPHKTGPILTCWTSSGVEREWWLLDTKSHRLRKLRWTLRLNCMRFHPVSTTIDKGLDRWAEPLKNTSGAYSKHQLSGHCFCFFSMRPWYCKRRNGRIIYSIWLIGSMHYTLEIYWLFYGLYF